MNDNARSLVVALRSGDYEQIRTRLRKGDGFCCLGVACDLFMKENPEWRWAPEDLMDQSSFARRGDPTEYTALPPKVKEWLGFQNNFGGFEPADVEDDTFDGEHVKGGTLADVNDSGFTFNQIADLIEREPLGLFNE